MHTHTATKSFTTVIVGAEPSGVILPDQSSAGQWRMCECVCHNTRKESDHKSMQGYLFKLIKCLKAYLNMNILYLNEKLFSSKVLSLEANGATQDKLLAQQTAIK